MFHGIRLSGMPAFKTNLTDTQLWQVSELVAHSSEISESVKKLLVQHVAKGASGHEPTAK